MRKWKEALSGMETGFWRRLKIAPQNDNNNDDEWVTERICKLIKTFSLEPPTNFLFVAVEFPF